MKILVEVGVVNREYAAALPHLLLLVGGDALGEVAEVWLRGEGLVLDTHRQHERVVGDHAAVVKDDVLVGSVDVSHTRVDDLDAGLKHELLELLEGVAGRVRLEVALLFRDVVMRQATW